MLNILERTVLTSGLQVTFSFEPGAEAFEPYRLKGMLKVVATSGFIFCALRSFAMHITGIYQRLSRQLNLFAVRDSDFTHPTLLNQRVDRANTATITARHTIHFVHDET